MFLATFVQVIEIHTEKNGIQKKKSTWTNENSELILYLCLKTMCLMEREKSVLSQSQLVLL